MINLKRFVHPSLTVNERNVSYALPSLSRNDAKSILSEQLAGGGVFGVEGFRSSITESYSFFSPPQLKTNWTMSKRDSNFNMLDEKSKNITCIQIYTEKASIFPTEMNNVNSFWEMVCEIVPKSISVMYQLLLAYRHDNWKDRLEEQYNDYLNGIQSPSNSKLFRQIQRNVSGKLDDLLKWEYKHPPIPEFDVKLKENGFRHSIRLVLSNGTKHERNKVIEALKQKLDEYSYTNRWNVASTYFSGDFVEDVKNRKLDNLGKQNVLCTSELLPFMMSEQVVHIEQSTVELMTANKNVKKANRNPFELLPMGSELKEDNGKLIAEKFIHALKELKGIKEEMVAKRVQSGSTLIKIVFDLPKGLKFSDINKASAIQDIQAYSGLKNLTIGLGENKSEFEITLPVEEKQKVLLRNYLETEEFKSFAENSVLPFVVGSSVVGEPIYRDLNELKHLVVVGSTGSGKSIFMNQFILTLLLTRKPHEVQFYLVDVKQVEFPIFERFPHVQSVITDADEGVQLLNKLTNEMHRRYTLFKDAEVKNIALYNNKFKDKQLPKIITVIDEYAELVMQNKDVNDYVQSLSQLARASGIHLVIASQRVSVDILNGTIKNNLQNKVVFKSSNTSSYLTVLDRKPDFVLNGRGDGLISFEGEEFDHIRFQGCLIVDDVNNEDLESKLLKEIAGSMNEDKVIIELPDVEEETEETELDKLRRIILETGETRVSQLREIMKVNINRLNSLMNELVIEGFLEKGESRQQGYKINPNYIKGEME